jgi:hypothetical protein
MKTYGHGDINPRILDIIIIWSGQLDASAALPPRKATSIHWIDGWVGLRTGVDNVERRKILLLPGLELQPLRPVSP